MSTGCVRAQRSNRVSTAIFDQFQTRVKCLKFLLFQAYAIVPLEQYEFATGARTEPHLTATMARRLPKLF
jgi:hypothetical protein